MKEKKHKILLNNPYYIPFMTRMYERLLNNATRAYQNTNNPKKKAHWKKCMKIIHFRRTEWETQVEISKDQL